VCRYLENSTQQIFTPTYFDIYATSLEYSSIERMHARCQMMFSITYFLQNGTLLVKVHLMEVWHLWAEKQNKIIIFQNQTISIMFSRVTLLLLACHLSSSTTPMIMYKNAQFVPTNLTFNFAVLSSISSWNECACQCFTNLNCFTATYFGINQSCSLFSVRLNPEWLQLVVSIMDVTVFSFTDRILIGKW
jgi:hypothetical protein